MRNEPIPRLLGPEEYTDRPTVEEMNEHFREVLNGSLGPAAETMWPEREEYDGGIDFSVFTSVGTRKLVSWRPTRREAEEIEQERWDVIYREVRDDIRRRAEEVENREDD